MLDRIESSREGCLDGVGVVDGLNVNGVAGYCGWRRKRVTKLRKLPSPACKGNATAVGRERNIEQSEWRLNLRLDFCADRWSNGGGSTVWFTACRSETFGNAVTRFFKN
ncbi:hypothetical protein Peur_057879 [Populus x canadensis]